MLVTGGYTGYPDRNYLDSTELLLPSATSWTNSAALPSPRHDLRGATLDNKVLVTGTNIMRHDLFHQYFTILQFITQCRGLGQPLRRRGAGI